ncbi:MAG: transglutaminase family protein [Oscillospiraceae bacterium]
MKAGIKFYGASVICPAVYMCSVSASLMYVIAREQALLCTLGMTALSFGVFMLFYVLRKHKGFAVLATAALAALCITVVGAVQQPYGYENSFMDFIFTASDFFDPVYAMAAILIFSVTVGFMCCFFSVYSPRPCFLLLVSFIPLILSVRTAGGLPLPLLAFMLGGFVMAAGGMARAERPSEFVYADDKKSRRERLIALLIAGAVAAGITAVVPRSEKTPMGDYLDTVFTGSTGGYYAVAQQLTNFRMQSSVNRGANKPEGTVLFTAVGEVPTYLDRAAFDTYEGGSKGWTGLKEYDTGYSGWEARARFSAMPVFINKLKAAAAEGKLEEYADIIKKLPAQDDRSRTMFLQAVDGSSTAVIIHPEGVYNVSPTSYSGSTYMNMRGDLFTESNLPVNGSYKMEYYGSNVDETAAAALAGTDFLTLVSDALDEEVISSAEASALRYEHSEAASYRNMVGKDGVTEKIQKLADEITAGLTSDLEKALAIEKWFGEAGFVYDMEFVPAKIDAEYFLFESRRGICSDFAAASVLLARAAGLSARYTEGFFITDEIRGESSDIYYVTDAQYHAYASVYAEGCGRVVIDGTKYAAQAGGEENYTAVIIAAAAAVLLILVIIFRKQLSELLFVMTYPLRKPSSKIRAIYLRTRALAAAVGGQTAESMTVGDTADIVSRSLGLPDEAGYICGAADMLFYGNGAAGDAKPLLGAYRKIRRRKRRMKK